jgi:hypothetical protein
MNQAEYHLKLVINLWCGAVPSQYALDSQLRDIWAMQVPNLDYDTFAITRLLSQIYKDPLFGICPAAHNLTPGLFINGGGIQTVNTLLVELLSCAESTQLSSAMEPFAKTISATTPKKGKKSPKKGR